MAVDTPSKDHNLFKSDRRLTTTLRGGTRAMRAAGQIYLPQEPKETPKLYENRLKRSVLTNFYRKAADKFSGKITRKAPELLESTPTEIEGIEDNIDNQGNSIGQMTEQALSQAVDDGVTFFFVDSPVMPETAAEAEGMEEGEDPVDPFPRTRAQDEELGLRPYVRHVTADQLLGWKHDVVDGRPVLRQIRIFEVVTEQDPDDPFNEVDVEQVRVVEPNLHVIWQKRKDAEGNEQWIIVQTIITDFEEIPLIPLYTNKIKFLVGQPLFDDLANLNVAHWQSDSDQNNIVHTIRVPILFGTGLTEAGEEPIIEIGPNSLTHGEAGSDLKYVEHTGAAAEVGFNALERLEANITRMGAEIILNKRTGNPTATARALDQAESDSEMATVSTNVEDTWKETFRHLLIAFGQEPDPEMDQIGVNMNKDFSLGLHDISAVKEFIAMRTNGDLSQQTLWFELKRIGILSEDFDEEAEEELLELEKAANMEREAEMMRTMGQIGEDPFDERDPNAEDDEEDEDE